MKAALPCPGSIRRHGNRMYKTERSLKRKTAKSCLCRKNKDEASHE